MQIDGDCLHSFFYFYMHTLKILLELIFKLQYENGTETPPTEIV